jgi:hypothetical protein
MAGAFVPSIEVEASDANLIMKSDVIFFGTGLRDISPISITVLPTDTLAQVKQKLVDAISAEATRLGLAVPASNMILPVFQKGA